MTQDEILAKARAINRASSEIAEVIKAGLCPTCGASLHDETVYGMHYRTICSSDRSHFDTRFTREQYIKHIIKL
jgi:hypothetical protein